MCEVAAKRMGFPFSKRTARGHQVNTEDCGMAEYHGLALEIRTGGESEHYELSGYSQPQVEELVHNAFSTPIPSPGAMRCTFTVGGGKNTRGKYHPDMSKFMGAALRGIG